MKSLLILLLAASTLFFADRAVRAENQRYAMSIRMCEEPLVPNATVMMWEARCLEEVETRISWFWHLFSVVVEPSPVVELW